MPLPLLLPVVKQMHQSMIVGVIPVGLLTLSTLPTIMPGYFSLPFLGSASASGEVDEPVDDNWSESSRPPHFKVVQPTPILGGQVDSCRHHECTVTALFNYKGGVEKTTKALNAGATLAKQGKKTLIADFDGQCNMTSFFHPPFKTEETVYTPYDGLIPSGMTTLYSHDASCMVLISTFTKVCLTFSQKS